MSTFRNDAVNIAWMGTLPRCMGHNRKINGTSCIILKICTFLYPSTLIFIYKIVSFLIDRHRTICKIKRKTDFKKTVPNYIWRGTNSRRWECALKKINCQMIRASWLTFMNRNPQKRWLRQTVNTREGLFNFDFNCIWSRKIWTYLNFQCENISILSNLYTVDIQPLGLWI